MKAPISGTMWCVCHICFHAVLSRPDRTFVGRGNRWISLYTMAGLKLAGSRPRSSVRVATLRRVCSAPPLSASVWLCCTCCRHALLHVCVAGAGGSWPFTRHGVGRFLLVDDICSWVSPPRMRLVLPRSQRTNKAFLLRSPVRVLLFLSRVAFSHGAFGISIFSVYLVLPHARSF
jgi:hypothetical protein